MMDEDLFFGVIGLDEAEALTHEEPRNLSRRHFEMYLPIQFRQT